MDFKRESEPIDVKLPKFIPKGCAEAQKILKREADKGKDAKILVYYDPDIDGLMAGLIAQTYLQQLGISSMYKLNENRSHGFYITDSDLAKLSGGVIVAVDFSISKFDFDRMLKAGVNLINIDHHEINVNDYTKTQDFVYSRCGDTLGVIINNQYACEPTEYTFLSGAGMVYYFFKYYSLETEVEVYSDYAAMVGISLLSDIRELESNEARMFLEYTFSLESSYLKYLTWLVSGESRSSQRFTPFGQPCISRDFIDFTFSPIINSLLRANKGEIALKLIRGNETVANDMRKNDYLLSFRTIQKAIIANIMAYIKEQEDVAGSLTRKYKNMTVCTLSSDFDVLPGSVIKYNSTNYIGVACSKIKDEDKTGVIFVIDPVTHLVKRGSVRGGIDGVNYLEIFQNNGVPCAGHHNAFGILECDVSKIDFEKISEDIEKAELDFTRNNKSTRHVVPIGSLGAFIKSPQAKTLCKINEFSRDNHRVYIKLVGDDYKNKIKFDKVSEKYTRYILDDVVIHSFDASLNVSNGFIVIGFENGKYIKCTLRPAFEYKEYMTTAELSEIIEKMFKGVKLS